MKEKILNYLKEHKNARLREMIAPVGATRSELARLLFTMKEEGLIESTLYRDMANMEIYDMWNIKA